MSFVNGIKGVSGLDTLWKLFGDPRVDRSQLVESLRLETLFVPFNCQHSINYLLRVIHFQ